MQKLRSLLVSTGAIVGRTHRRFRRPTPRFPKDTEGDTPAFTADTHLCMVVSPIARVAISITVVDHPSSEHLASMGISTRELVSQLCP
jgi:hypothetical protein